MSILFNSAFTPNASRRPLGVRGLALKVLKMVWFLQLIMFSGLGEHGVGSALLVNTRLERLRVSPSLDDLGGAACLEATPGKAGAGPTSAGVP